MKALKIFIVLISVWGVNSIIYAQTTTYSKVKVYITASSEIEKLRSSGFHAEMEVISILGKVVKSVSLDPLKHEISIPAEQNKGLYWIKIINSSLSTKPVMVRFE